MGLIWFIDPAAMVQLRLRFTSNTPHMSSRIASNSFVFAGALLVAAMTLTAPSTSSAQAPASPRDSVKATVGGASIAVNYGRPSKRGREVFGGLVPFGTVWRTGANAATAFTTTKALRFGSTTVPAGSYTLYTLPDQSGKWQLIVNKQTGQWGTVYDQALDLVRVPLTVEQIPSVVEQMAISVTPSANGGELAVIWDRTKAKTSFVVAP